MHDDTPYTKREQDEWRSDVKDQLDRIEAQTIKTNGRVSKLEAWKGILMGGSLVVWVVVVPLIIYIYNLKLTDVDVNINKLEQNFNQKK